MSSSSSDKFNCDVLKRQKDIATAVYLDDEKNLEIFVRHGRTWFHCCKILKKDVKQLLYMWYLRKNVPLTK